MATTIHVAHTRPVNPAGASPALTAAQVWAGLERKARRPQDFVPVVESCEILSETAPDAGEGGRVIRAVVVFKPDSGVAHALRISETCTLRPPCRLDYDMDDGSTAVNIVSSSADGELFLTFVFAWVHSGGGDLSTAEQKYRATAGVAVAATINTIRSLAEKGEL